MATLSMDTIVEGVIAAGFAAHVEQTGGGCATIQASRAWEDRPITRMGRPAGTIRVPARAERYDALAGPGWFEGTDAFADSSDFVVGRDDDGEGPTMVCASEHEAVAAIVSFLLSPPRGAR